MLNQLLGPKDVQIGSWIESINCGGRYNYKSIQDSFLYPNTWPSLATNLARGIARRPRAAIRTTIHYGVKDRYREILGPNPACPTAAQIKLAFPCEWEQYYKFSVARNPFDYEISDYFWRCQRLIDAISFEEFIRRKFNSEREDPENIVPFPKTNWPIYAIEDNVELDYIARYEYLESDISFLSKQLGLKLQLFSSRKAKAQYRPKLNAQDFYSPEVLAITESLHRRELDYFGYTFPYS